VEMFEKQITQNFSLAYRTLCQNNQYP